MIKKIIFCISLFVTTCSWSQDNTASPYSYYGLGEPKFRGTQDVRSMGGIGIMSDSLQLNLLNPASYSRLLTTNFSIGGTSSFTTMKNSSESEKVQRTTLDYIAVGFPVGKIGFSFGLMPYSAVGYRNENTFENTNDQTTRREIKRGEGNVNKVFIGTSYNINKKLSFGFELGYHFGEITNNYIEFITEPAVPLGTIERNNSNIRGISFNTGLLYQTKLNSKLNLQTSLTFSPETKLKSDNTSYLSTVSLGANNIEIVDNQNGQEINVADTEIRLPSKFGFGAGIGESKKWLIGSEIVYTQSSVLTNRFGNPENATFENATKIGIGGYYIPKYDSFSSYFSRIVYRAGFRYENTGLVIRNQSIKDYGMTFGLGLPLGISKIDLGFEFGKRGTTNNALIEENYFNLNIGLSFSDIWFKKRKID
ncbi:hypothetical protein [Flavobacterium cucumis]|nr:hypothetical protein [Flavobacterium cucumis]